MRLSIRLLVLILLGMLVIGFGCSSGGKKGTVDDTSDAVTDTDGGPVGPIACQVNLDCLGQPGQNACNSGSCDQATGFCVLWAKPNCCLTDEECDDGSEDTQEICDLDMNICRAINFEQPCQTELDCPGLDVPCMAVDCQDYCITSMKPDCCVTSEDCDDGDDCTTDQCGTFECTNDNKEDPICCVETVVLHSFSSESLSEYGLTGNNQPVAWHHTTDRSNSPGGALRFADPDTGTYSNPKVDNEIPASLGTFQLPMVGLPIGTGDLTLTFWLWLDIEEVPLFDLFTLRAVRDGGDLGNVIWSKEALAPDAYRTWTQVSVDITGLEGQNVALIWDVDTLDGNLNQGEGVYLDDIVITAGCGEPTACTSDEECVSDSPCLEASCNAGVCMQTSVDDCCVTADDCPTPPGSCGELVGCIDNACEYDLKPPCCVTDADCNDDQPNACGVCTTIGMCSYSEKIECCVDSECDDNDVCTTDDCRADGTCRSEPIEGCGTSCNDNEECDDQDGCTEDACVGGECKYGPVTCMDDDPCTVDVCQDGACEYLVDPNCVPPCIVNSDCADGDPCTQDICQPNNVCTNEQLPNCGGDCSSAMDCNDGNDCTTDVCSGGTCTFLPIAGCGEGCKTTADCDDGNPCSIDVCAASGACGHSLDPNCTVCQDGPVYAKSFDVPAENLDWTLSTPVQGVGWTLGPVGNSTSGVGSLYYGNPETKTYDNGLHNFGSATSGTVVIAPTAPGAELTFMLYADIETLPGYDELELRVVTTNATTAVWNKGNLAVNSFGQWQPITVDLSMYAGQAIQLQWYFDSMDPIQNDSQGVYVDDVVVNQFCTIPACGTNQDCDDGDECTTDMCASGTCQYIPIPGCGAQCQTDLDCDNSLFCVINACIDGQCVAVIELPDCCESDAGCNDNDNCTQDLCAQNQCLYLDIPGCGVQDCSVDFDCNDGDPCTQDLCDSGVCLNKVIVGCCSADGQCDDNDSCTFDTCFDGACAHVTLPGCGPSCQSDSDCVDDDPCTSSVCFQNFCATQQQPGCCNSSTQCSDGNDCTTDVCVNNECAYNPKPNCCVANSQCDDNNPCTDNACVAGSCTSTPNANCCTSNSQCEDGDPCTENSCQDGQCVSKVAPDCCESSLDCNDGNACTTDVCSNGQCLNQPISDCCTSNTQCNDGNACTSDSCVGGTCVSSPIDGCCTSSAQCGDGNACTQDVCAENQCINKTITDCCTSSSQCSDGNVCTTDVCSNNQCVNQPVSGCCTSNSDCNDDDPCTADVCDASTGLCANTPGGGANCCTGDDQCDDGNPCTDNSCGPNGECVATPNTGGCDDGLFCNGTDQCAGGVCQHSGDPCKEVGDDDFDCTESCNEANNNCTFMDPEGSLCSDGNPCTTGDACNFAGTCIPGVDPCDGPDGDGNCAESCDSATGLCGSADPDGSTCGDDGDPCTMEACVGGACVSSEVAGCCTADTQCDDGDPCTADACQANQCQNVTTPECCEPQSVLASNFDSGPGGWTATGSNDSQWQLSGNNSMSAPNAFWFGNADTGDFSCDQSSCSGVLSSPPISFPSNESLLLTFSTFVDVEEDPNWDSLELRIMSGPTGGKVLWDKSVMQAQDFGTWQTYKVDLSAFQGQTLTLRWFFDTGDAINNGGDGIYLDNVTIDTSCQSLADLCVFNTDCIDSDPCTENVCVNSTCQFVENPNCCKADAECDDGYVCTSDQCVGGACQHVAVPGCCQFDGECNDDNSCTADSCVGGNCSNLPVAGPGCCKTSADCDDSDGCTQDTCANFQCEYQSSTGPGCCLAGDLLSENFDNATSGSLTLIDDDSGALWSVQNQRFFSGPFSLYYGVPGEWTTNTGSSNSGQAISAPISIPLGSESVVLTFAVWADVVGGGPFGGDSSFVIQVLDGNTLKTVWTLGDNEEQQWSLQSAELNEYKGKTIQLYFETNMPPFGNAEGIYLDNIKLTNTCKGPPVIINP